MATAMSFPNFIVIGAARSGTTALHYLLGQHPQIYMCPVKEPNFFAFDGQLENLSGPGVAQLADHSVADPVAYRRLFDGVRAENAVGEVSPRYMLQEGCAERIARNLPGVKLVAILRHPVERAWSSFMGHRKDGWEDCSDLREAFQAEPSRIAAGQSMGLHFSTGCYAKQLRPYFDRFERRRIYIALYEDFQRTPATLLRDLFSFLGVDDQVTVDASRRYNPSGKIRNPVLRQFWQRSGHLRRSLRRWIPESWRDRAYAKITRDLERFELPPELRREYTAFFRDDILQLADLMDRNLDHWL